MERESLEDRPFKVLTPDDLGLVKEILPNGSRLKLEETTASSGLSATTIIGVVRENIHMTKISKT